MAELYSHLSQDRTGRASDACCRTGSFPICLTRTFWLNPVGGNACIIDIDGLVVPGKFPPDVVGTPDFIAPEVMASLKLSPKDANRALPKIETDRHALAVLIYMYLLYRHPLRGSKIHDQDPQLDEELAMGERAMFVEHPTDASNRPNTQHARKGDLPWADVSARSYAVTGPYLKELFDKAFIEGLHDPSNVLRRTTGNEHSLKPLTCCNRARNPIAIRRGTYSTIPHSQRVRFARRRTKDPCPF